MSKEQEAQQTQIIAGIKHNQGLRTELCNFNGVYVDCQKLLEIADAKAQKIVEQAKEIDALKVRIAGLHAYIDEAQAVK